MMGSDVGPRDLDRTEWKQRGDYNTLLLREDKVNQDEGLGTSLEEGLLRGSTSMLTLHPMRAYCQSKQSLHTSDIHSCILGLPLDCNLAFETGLHWLPCVLIVS